MMSFLRFLVPPSLFGHFLISHAESLFGSFWCLRGSSNLTWNLLLQLLFFARAGSRTGQPTRRGGPRRRYATAPWTSEPRMTLVDDDATTIERRFATFA